VGKPGPNAQGLTALRALAALQPGEGRALLVLCGLLLAAFWPQLAPGVMASDDWGLSTTRDFTATHRFELSQGRFLQAALHALLFALGPDPVYAHSLLSLLAIPLLAFAALLCARVLGLAPRHAFVCALAFLDWTHTELWTFRLGPFFLAVASLCAIAAVALLRAPGHDSAPGVAATRPLPVVTAALLLCAALATYQTAFNLAALLLVLALLGDLLDDGPAALRRALLPLGAFALGLAVYFTLQRGVVVLFDLQPDPRSRLLHAAEVPGRFFEARRYVVGLLWRDLWLRPQAVAALEVLLLVLGVLGAVVQSVRERAPARFWIALPLGIAAALCLSGVALPLLYWNGVLRLGLAHGLLLAGGAALALRFLPSRRAHRLTLALAGVLVLCDAGLAHRVFGEQRAKQDRDLAQAVLVTARLLQQPGFPQVRRISAVGHSPWYEGQLIRGSDLNHSALSVPWSIAPLFTAASGRALSAPSDEEQAGAVALCSSSPKWPAEGSLAVRGDLAVVCF
jgi:hypothetical protein